MIPALSQPPAVAPCGHCVYIGDSYLRLLGTGSRTWRYRQIIWDAYTECLLYARACGKILVCVHGDAAGADMIFKRFGDSCDGALQEPHPADWDGPCRACCKPGHRVVRSDGSSYCPQAGNYRNAEMVALPAWRTAAFIRDRSRGATNCETLMKKHGHWPRTYRDDAGTVTGPGLAS